MLYSILADVVVIIHFLFILFVLFGGLMVLRWRKAVYFHIPAFIWGALIEIAGWICPLTPLENKLRSLAGQSGYSGDFIGHYLEKIIYPDFLTREIQIIFGSAVIIVNLIIYGYIIFGKSDIKKAASKRNRQLY